MSSFAASASSMIFSFGFALIVLDRELSTDWFSFSRSLSIRSSRARGHFTWRSLLGWCCRWFPVSVAGYIGENDLFPDFFECFLLALSWLRSFFLRGTCTILLLFFLLYFLPLYFEVFWFVRRYVVFLDREFFPEQPSVELKVHRQQIFMRSK